MNIIRNLDKWVVVIMAVVLCLLLMCFVFENSYADTTKLAWDPAQESLEPDGYRLFQKVDDGEYNYNSPLIISGSTDDQGNIPPDVLQVDVDTPGEACKVLTYKWVVRAYKADDESGDSNEVSAIVDLSCPSEVTSFSAEFNKDASSISMSFQQPSGVDVAEWKIFWTRTPGDNYQLFDTVQNDGSNTATVTKAFTEVESGLMETIYFTIVSFKDDQLFSPNSSEIAIVIDRRELTAPTLRKVEIPVE